MKAIICENCGSTELYEEGGYSICRYCGTKHLITMEDKPEKQSTIGLKDDVSKLLQKCKEDPARAEKYAQLILEIDPNNVEAKGYLTRVTKENSSKGCYIATAVYGSYDCPQVWTLRRYRDNRLSKTWYGRFFISMYYSVSPMLVKLIGDKRWFKKICKLRLDRFVRKLKEEGVPDTSYQDS